MPYNRLKPASPLSAEQKKEFLKEYLQWVAKLADESPSNLNVKLPREAVAGVLDRIGEILLEEAQKAIDGDENPLRDFLSKNPVPESLALHLDDRFRAFCLLLNATKQWVSAEQNATDRYLLGGRARDALRQSATHCVVSGEPLADGRIELHHMVRDGRPPVPLSPEGHRSIEEIRTTQFDDPIGQKIQEIRARSGRSWRSLQIGCLIHLNRTDSDYGLAKTTLASSKSFAKKVHEETGLSYEALLDWMDQQELSEDL